MLLRGFPAALLAGVTAGFVAIGMNAANLIPLTGIASGLAVILVMVLMLKVRGRKIVDRSVAHAGGHRDRDGPSRSGRPSRPGGS